MPRLKLREILQRYGPGLVDDPRRCRALLLDLCGAYRTEIFVLTTAQEAQVPDRLQVHAETLPLSVRIAQLTQQLVRQRALAEPAARWAVVSWAWALGMPVNLEAGPDGASAPVIAPGRVEGASHSQKKQIALSSPAPDPRRGGIRKGHYISNWAAVEVSGRPRSQRPLALNAPGPVLGTSHNPGAWRFLGRTPGDVKLPLDLVIGLKPQVPAQDIVLWIQELGGSPDIVSLDFDGTVPDEALKALATLPALARLSIGDGASLTDAGMAHLGALRHLQALELSSPAQVSDRGFAYLGELASLVSLDVAWASISDAALGALGNLNALADLTLRHCKRLVGRGLGALKALFRLRSLNLAGGQCITDAGLVPIGVLTSLRQLNLSQCPAITEEGLAHLAPLANLRYLDLSWNDQLRGDALSVVRQFVHLEVLNLSHLSIANGALAQLRTLRALRHLDLAGCVGITDRGLHHLKALKTLAYLDLTGCSGITSRGVERLSRPGLYIAHKVHGVAGVV